MAGVRSSGLPALPEQPPGCCAAALCLCVVPLEPRNLGAWWHWFFLIRASDYFYSFLIRGACFPGVDAGPCSGAWVYLHRFARDFTCCTQVGQWLWR